MENLGISGVRVYGEKIKGAPIEDADIESLATWRGPRSHD
jgi:hypothetical protein